MFATRCPELCKSCMKRTSSCGCSGCTASCPLLKGLHDLPALSLRGRQALRHPAHLPDSSGSDSSGRPSDKKVLSVGRSAGGAAGVVSRRGVTDRRCLWRPPVIPWVFWRAQVVLDYLLSSRRGGIKPAPDLQHSRLLCYRGWQEHHQYQHL